MTPPRRPGPTEAQIAAQAARDALHARARAEIVGRDVWHGRTREDADRAADAVVEILLDEENREIAAAWSLNMFGLDVTTAGVVVVPIHRRSRRTVADVSPFLAGGYL